MPAAAKTVRATSVDLRIKMEGEKQGSKSAGPLSADQRALVELLMLRANLIAAPRHPVHDGSARATLIACVAQTAPPRAHALANEKRDNARCRHQVRQTNNGVAARRSVFSNRVRRAFA
eukprot:1309143-Pyramimonas_sp.AAC.1